MACPDVILLPREIAQEMVGQIISLMRQYHYNPYGSDFQCAFCFNCPLLNNDEIVHNENCYGNRFLTALENGMANGN